MAGGTGRSFLDRLQNAYDPITFQHIPAKTRVSVGGLAQRTFDNNIIANARIERIWTREKEFVAFGVPPVTSDGWLFLGGVTIAR